MKVAPTPCISAGASADNADQSREELKNSECDILSCKPVRLFYESTGDKSDTMRFRCLKFKTKDKPFPQDKPFLQEKPSPKGKPFLQDKPSPQDKPFPQVEVHEDTMPNPPGQPEAALTPVLLPPKEAGGSTYAEPSPPPDQQLSSPAPGPLGPALEDNEEIQKIWTEIQDKVASLARRDGRPVKTGMEIEDVMGTLYSTEHPDVEPRKRDAVKETFNNTLKVIQTVGGFVADGASQVRDTRPH